MPRSPPTAVPGGWPKPSRATKCRRRFPKSSAHAALKVLNLCRRVWKSECPKSPARGVTLWSRVLCTKAPGSAFTAGKRSRGRRSALDGPVDGGASDAEEFSNLRCRVFHPDEGSGGGPPAFWRAWAVDPEACPSTSPPQCLHGLRARIGADSNSATMPRMLNSSFPTGSWGS